MTGIRFIKNVVEVSSLSLRSVAFPQWFRDASFKGINENLLVNQVNLFSHCEIDCLTTLILMIMATGFVKHFFR